MNRLLKIAAREFSIKSISKWFLIAFVVGILTGVTAIIFNLMLIYFEKFFLVNFTGLIQPLPHGEKGEILTVSAGNPLLRLFVPAFGGLVVGYIIYKFAPETAGHGTDAVIESYHRRRGIIRPIVPIIKMIASAFTLGTGGSGGREGPIAQTGGGIGSILAKFLNLNEKEKRITVLSGVGGGIGSIFRAPLGGALFSAEVLYRQADFEGEAVMPSIISAITAYSVFGFFASWHPIFTTPPYSFNVKELGFFAILGILMVPFSYIYVKVFYATKHYFDILKIKPYFKPMLGGLLTGLILLFVPHVAGTSYGWMQLALLGELSVWMMLLIALAKIFATAFTIGSGGSGGVFAPSLVIGGMIGGAVGTILNHFFPAIVTDPSPYMMVGMGSFFAAAAKVPLATIVMVAEMTGNYDMLVPVTLASSLAFLLSGKWSIYEHQVDSKLDSPAHRGDFVVDVLESIKVRDVKTFDEEVPYVTEDMDLLTALRQVSTTPYNIIPVINRENKLVGILNMDDVRGIIYDGDLEVVGKLTIVKDVERTTFPLVKPSDTLQRALDLFIQSGFDELPVTDESKKCLGILSRKELLQAYNRSFLEKVP